jgi:hypothetical protein
MGKVSYQRYVNNHIRVVNMWIRELLRERATSRCLISRRCLQRNTVPERRNMLRRDGRHPIPLEGIEKLTGYMPGACRKLFVKSMDSLRP